MTEYNHNQAVADGVNVDFDVYRIRTQITEGGSTIDANFYVDRRDRLTRQVRWEKLDDEFTYEAGALDRSVVAMDQIRTVVRTFRDELFTEILPSRTSAILYSFTGTCRHHEIDPFAYLQEVITRLPTQPKDWLEELLPDASFAARPRTPRKVAA